MKIALLGSIPKGDDIRAEWTDRKETYIRTIRHEIPSAEFVHGDSVSDNVGPELVVGHDLAMVREADICIVDVRQKTVPALLRK